MPWSEVSVVDQRRRFVEDVRLGVFTFRELCERYDVSRPTGYRWVERFEQEGLAGLTDRSHRTHGCPHATAAHVWQAVGRARHEHPTWGPMKLLWLVAKRLDEELPAPSTVAGWLNRNGLVAARRRRPQRPHPGKPHGQASAPNGLWTIDFKGHFRTRDGRYCYPLLFREYGLPERMRSDNGAPFASLALARLYKLSAWWSRLGITPEHIEPGHPEQNLRHERMHRTLKDDTTRPPAATCRAQQVRFHHWRKEYNEARPHESLDQQPPATLYRPSPRPYPARRAGPEYPGHFEVRRVSRNGGIRWASHRVPVSHSMLEEYIGFEPVDDGLWDAYYLSLPAGPLQRTSRAYH